MAKQANMKMTREVVTPEKARKYLATQEKNRTLSAGRVKRIADEIKSGEFGVCVTPIVFDKQGRLIDGQHRLSAIVRARKAVDLFVCRDAPRSAFDTMDIGRARKVHDVLHAEGWQYASMVAAISRALLTYQNSPLGTVFGVEFSHKRRVLAARKLEAPEKIQEWARRLGKVKLATSPPIFAAYVLHISGHEELAEKLIRQLTGDEPISKTDAAWAFLQAERRRREKIPTRKHYHQNEWLFGIAVFLANAMLSGKEVRGFRLPKLQNAEFECMPRPRK